jgi:membrane protein involved in colicin uptake
MEELEKYGAPIRQRLLDELEAKRQAEEKIRQEKEEAARKVREEEEKKRKEAEEARKASEAARKLAEANKAAAAKDTEATNGVEPQTAQSNGDVAMEGADIYLP